jgi:hypothetical protein
MNHVVVPVDYLLTGFSVDPLVLVEESVGVTWASNSAVATILVADSLEGVAVSPDGSRGLHDTDQGSPLDWALGAR